MPIENLFHGTNKKDFDFWDEKRFFCLTRKWTQNPCEAMGFSYDISKKYQSEMVLLVLPEWDAENFIDTKNTFEPLFGKPLEPKWYEGKAKLNKVDCREQQLLLSYQQTELEKFIDLYVSPENQEKMKGFIDFWTLNLSPNQDPKR